MAETAFAEQNTRGPARGRSGKLARWTAALGLSLVLLYVVYRLASMFGFLGSRTRVGDLPLVEVPATATRGRLMVVFLSADGGWAGLDQMVSARLAAAGIPVVGWNSLRYYLTPRTPEEAAEDLAHVITRYRTSWRADRVVVIGYSFGADVLPFLVNRLPPDQRDAVAGTVLLGFASDAAFVFRPSEWFGRWVASRGRPTLLEVRRLVELPILCIDGDKDATGACRRIRTTNVSALTVPSGHPLGSQGDSVATLVLGWIRALPAKESGRPASLGKLTH